MKRTRRHDLALGDGSPVVNRRIDLSDEKLVKPLSPSRAMEGCDRDLRLELSTAGCIVTP